MGSFSFQETKSLPAGEGGIVLTDNDELADRASLIHNIGRIIGKPGCGHPLPIPEALPVTITILFFIMIEMEPIDELDETGGALRVLLMFHKEGSISRIKLIG